MNECSKFEHVGGGAMHDLFEQSATWSRPAFVPKYEPSRTRICRACGGTMVFVTSIMRVTEPGRMHMFECAECKKLDFMGELSR